MKKITPLVLACSVLSVSVTTFTPTSSYAVEKVGIVLTAKGNVNASQGGKIRNLKRRSSFYLGDVIKTAANSFTQIRFLDGTLVSLKANTEFGIKDYVYKKGAKGNKNVSSLVKGGMRSLTGLINKKNKGAYEIKTPVVNVETHGTTFALGIQGKKAFWTVSDGSIEVGDKFFGPNEAFQSGMANSPNNIQGLTSMPSELNSTFDAGHLEDMDENEGMDSNDAMDHDQDMEHEQDMQHDEHGDNDHDLDEPVDADSTDLIQYNNSEDVTDNQAQEVRTALLSVAGRSPVSEDIETLEANTFFGTSPGGTDHVLLINGTDETVLSIGEEPFLDASVLNDYTHVVGGGDKETALNGTGIEWGMWSARGQTPTRNLNIETDDTKTTFDTLALDTFYMNAKAADELPTTATFTYHASLASSSLLDLNDPSNVSHAKGLQNVQLALSLANNVMMGNLLITDSLAPNVWELNNLTASLSENKNFQFEAPSGSHVKFTGGFGVNAGTQITDAFDYDLKGFITEAEDLALSYHFRTKEDLNGSSGDCTMNGSQCVSSGIIIGKKQ